MAGPSFRAAPVRVRVPATSANLGPGFDSAGLALRFHNDVVVRVADSGVVLDVAGEGAEKIPRDRRNLMLRAMRETFDRLGGQPRGLEVVAASRIPHARGLGSSAAAIVAGVVGARALTLGGDERLPDPDVIDLAARIEGHPDNVAACLLGGFTLAWAEDGTGDSPTRFHAVRLEPDPAVRTVVFVPATTSSTSKSRAALPEHVPHGDGAFNAGRAALLVVAVTGRTDLLLAATEDRLHQRHRAASMARSVALVDQLRRGGVAAVISGSGPTVLALTVAAEADDLVAANPGGVRFTASALDVDLDGARLEAVPS